MSESALTATHFFALRVYYEDTDAAGIVYYANYLKFAERARTELMRSLGVEHSTLLAETGLAFAVRALSADYRAPARLDDRLEVATRLLALRGATIEIEQVVRKGPSELVRLVLKLVCISRAGRPARIPQPVAAALARFSSTDQP